MTASENDTAAAAINLQKLCLHAQDLSCLDKTGKMMVNIEQWSCRGLGLEF